MRRCAICSTRAACARICAKTLRRVPDMDRALSRLALDRGGPRDLTAIRAGLTQALSLHKRLQATPRLCWLKPQDP
jgi:DNA mismatch repair ATPase MutS